MTPSIARAIFDAAQESADREDFYAELIGLVGAFAMEHIGITAAQTLLMAEAHALEEETRQ